MAPSRGLRRLFQVRGLEEELSQAALEEALENLHLLKAAFEAARDRERSGRRLVTASAASADVADRIAGLEETRAASRRVAGLKPRIAEMEAEVAARRTAFLANRMARRQVEALISKTKAADAIGAGRRAQREIDDWFLRDTGRGDAAVKRR